MCQERNVLALSDLKVPGVDLAAGRQCRHPPASHLTTWLTLLSLQLILMWCCVLKASPNSNSTVNARSSKWLVLSHDLSPSWRPSQSLLVSFQSRSGVEFAWNRMGPVARSGDWVLGRKKNKKNQVAFPLSPQRPSAEQWPSV